VQGEGGRRRSGVKYAETKLESMLRWLLEPPLGYTVDRAHAGRKTDRIVIPAKYLQKLSFVAAQVLHS